MAVMITGKKGTPFKISNILQTALKPKVASQPLPSLPKFIPTSIITKLSKPEGPTTTNIKQMEANIPARHAAVYMPLPDRGGNRMHPFQGVSVTLPNIKTGGAPNRITPVLKNIAEQTKKIMPANNTVAGKLQYAIRRVAMIEDFSKKKVSAVLTPGPSGLDFAQSPRRYTDAITGKLKMRSAFPIIRKKGIGIFSQHRTAPKEIVNRLAEVSARKRASLVVPQSQILTGAKKVSEAPLLTIGRIDAATSIAAPIATNKVEEESRGVQRMIFLGAVVFVSFLILRGNQ